jgi:glutathione S-transferase
MRLYYHPLSTNARRVVLTAAQLGTSLELVVVDFSKGEQKRPEFLRMNPNGWVPVLDDDGFYLHESHAIIQYLADGTPGQTVYPTERRARANLNRWLFWSAQHFQPAIGLLLWERIIKRRMNLGGPDEYEVERGERLFGEVAPILDAQLKGEQWVLGDTLTLADLALSAPLTVMEPAQVRLLPYPNIQSWLGRMQNLDAWKQTTA